MKTLSFKTKILLLVIVPLVLVSIALTLLAVSQAQKLGDKNVENFSTMIFDLRRAELKNYTDLALSSVEHVFNNSDSPIAAQQNAKDLLKSLEFGEDGYFFVYDFNGVALAHPKKPQLEGKNLWNIQDSNGVYLIRSLVENARRDDGGYTDYIWDKPSKGREVGKIGHSVGFSDWDWMIGTGLYIDDLEDAVASVESQIQADISSTLLLIIGLATIFTLLVGIIGVRFTMSEGKLADEKLQQLSRKAVEGQEEERSRVARDLQKGINTSLHAVRSRLKNVAKAGNIETPDSRKEFIAAVSILDETIKEVYRISGELRPEMLDKMGLYPAVEALAEQLSAENPIAITFKKSESGERLREELETTIYRMVQEALKNIIKHSQASEASVRMRQTRSSISLTIQDNGRGFDAQKLMSGNAGQLGTGFVDIRIRAESLGGTFSIFSSEDVGTVLKIDIPTQ